MSQTESELNKIYYPSKEVIKKALVKDYDSLYKKSIENREEFWAAEAKKLEWYKKWDKVLDDSDKPFYKWFTGGQINISSQCTRPASKKCYPKQNGNYMGR